MSTKAHEIAYASLFDTPLGKDHLSIVSHLVRVIANGERWTLPRVVAFVARMLDGRPADSVLTHEALMQCWLCGLLRSRMPEGESHELLVEWVKI
jgi:hypothetical protein